MKSVAPYVLACGFALASMTAMPATADLFVYPEKGQSPEQ